MDFDACFPLVCHDVPFSRLVVRESVCGFMCSDPTVVACHASFQFFAAVYAHARAKNFVSLWADSQQQGLRSRGASAAPTMEERRQYSNTTRTNCFEAGGDVNHNYVKHRCGTTPPGGTCADVGQTCGPRWIFGLLLVRSLCVCHACRCSTGWPILKWLGCRM